MTDQLKSPPENLPILTRIQALDPVPDAIRVAVTGTAVSPVTHSVPAWVFGMFHSLVIVFSPLCKIDY